MRLTRAAKWVSCTTSEDGGEGCHKRISKLLFDPKLLDLFEIDS